MAEGYIWNVPAETMPREELSKLQLERLKQVVARVSERVPFYKELYAEAGVSAGDIQSLDDIAKLPFTVKQDLRDNYPFGMFASPVGDLKPVENACDVVSYSLISNHQLFGYLTVISALSN